MKIFDLLFICLLGGMPVNAQDTTERSCDADELHDQGMLDPDYRAGFEDRMARMREVLQEQEGNRTPDCANVISLPMAIHYQGASNVDVECLRELAVLQVQILNDDYQGTNADVDLWTNGAAQFFPGVSNGESCINFCIPNSGHPAGYGLADGDPAITINTTSGSFESDWSGYINVYVRNIGALGFSPLGGVGNGDGVTVDRNAFSAGAGCSGFQPSAPYHLGRTLTHELGHYLGLPHIWGGGCGQDDGVEDTPNSSDSYGGCPSNSAASCGSTDMHMNYLDYVNDACMYMYSAGQIAVQDAYATANLQNVITNADVCGEAPEPTPTVNFVSSGQVIDEGTSGCLGGGRRTIPVAVSISAAPSADATVTISAFGTAEIGSDYTLGATSVTFPAGSTAEQSIDVIINEDAAAEEDETIELSFSVNANGGNAVPGNSSPTIITILNDDLSPSDFDTEIAVASNINGGFADFYLGPQATIHFFDQLNGNIMLSVINASFHDYGCTNVSIDRADEGSPGATESLAGEVDYVTDKTFFISPEQNDFNNSFTVRLYYTTTEINGFLAESNREVEEIRMIKSDIDIPSATNNLELVTPSSEAFGVGFYYEASYTSGMAGFALGVDASTLPVEMVSFTATAEDKAIRLDWVTAVELNNRGFEVLRRAEQSRSFEAIGWVAAAGNADGGVYTFEDATAVSGEAYFYQLRQLDLGATESFSDIVSAQLAGRGARLTAFPNPFGKELEVTVATPLAGELRLTSVDGRVLRRITLEAGGSQRTMSLSEVPAGVYLLVFETAEEQAVQKVVKR
jgi:hypothetical protein